MSHDYLLSEPNEAPFALSNLPLTSAVLAANAHPMYKSSLLIDVNNCPCNTGKASNITACRFQITHVFQGKLTVVAMQTQSLQATLNLICYILLVCRRYSSAIIWLRWKMQCCFSELMKAKQRLRHLITCWLLMSYGDSIMHQIIILTEEKIDTNTHRHCVGKGTTAISMN